MSGDDPRRFHDRVRLDTGPDGLLARVVMERGNRPANAFSAGMVDGMTEAVVAVPGDVRVVVLTGEGEFSVGADLGAVAAAEPDDRPEIIEATAAASNRFIRAVRGFDRPVVAAVNGTAAGGGLGFALACDVVVMHEAAVLDPAYARIGLTPDNATPYFLARALGPYRARELLFRPRPVDAEEAVSLGLVAEVVGGDGAAFDSAVESFCAGIARPPSTVQAGTKALVDAALDEPLDRHLERERETIRRAAEAPAFDEGLAAFFEDRQPDWAADADALACGGSPDGA